MYEGCEGLFHVPSPSPGQQLWWQVLHCYRSCRYKLYISLMRACVIIYFEVAFMVARGRTDGRCQSGGCISITITINHHPSAKNPKIIAAKFKLPQTKSNQMRQIRKHQYKQKHHNCMHNCIKWPKI